MMIRDIVLNLVVLYQVFGSRLGSPKDKSDRPIGWAWKNADEQHAPPGHLAPHEAPDGSHAWAGKGKQPWNGQMPENVDDMPMNGDLKRQVMTPPKEEDIEVHDIQPQSVVKKSVTAKYDTRKYDASTESASDSTVQTSSSTDLQGTLAQDCADSMNLAQFMPKCLKHTKSLIADLDYNYGDAQLETILRNWCSSAQEFPNARGTRKVIGFKNHQSCTDFADDLKNARYKELKTTSDQGYKDFCTAFYAHHGGFDASAPPPPKEEPVKSSCTSLAGLSFVMMTLMLLLA